MLMETCGNFICVEDKEDRASYISIKHIVEFDHGCETSLGRDFWFISVYMDNRKVKMEFYGHDTMSEHLNMLKKALVSCSSEE